MRIVGLSEQSGHTSLVTRVLILALLQGGILLQGSTLGYAISGTADGFFGGVNVSGWYSADQSSSTINIIEALGISYTFTGRLRIHSG
jgi:hypothetical protein